MKKPSLQRAISSIIRTQVESVFAVASLSILFSVSSSERKQGPADEPTRHESTLIHPLSIPYPCLIHPLSIPYPLVYPYPSGASVHGRTDATTDRPTNRPTGRPIQTKILSRWIESLAVLRIKSNMETNKSKKMQ